MNAFEPISGKLSLDLMKAAKVNYDNQTVVSTTRNNALPLTRNVTTAQPSPHIPAISRRRTRNNQEDTLNDVSSLLCLCGV